LRATYPVDFSMRLVNAQGHAQDVTLAELDGLSGQALFVPALAAGSSFEAFQEIIAHLRAPEDGCPWDKEQTHLSLRKHLLEEAYETLSALDEQDTDKMREEFGDLLLQIVLNAQIASEHGEFNMAGVLVGIHDKIVRRHPHVFGDVQVDGVGEVLSNWEKIKADERKKDGHSYKGALDGLPSALPALILAQEFQDRAARVGFDWPEIEGVLAKVREEIEEVRAASSPEELTDELGDLFFALVNLARWKKIDAEAAVRAASQKFKKRFKYVENRAHAMGRLMPELSLDELDGLWNEAKM
jgi:tetrapyrrole methylase family protein/MazG family protein